jgi:hypothetical protein
MPAQPLKPKSAQLWSPRPPLAPRVSREGEALVVASNGSEGCYGGWELKYALPPTEWVNVQARAQLSGLRWGLDHVHAAVVWEGFEPLGVKWEPLMPAQMSGDDVVFRMRCQRPPGATGLLVRLMIAWAPAGEVRWTQLKVEPAPPPRPRKWRLGAAGGPLGPGKRNFKSNTEAYLALARAAAEQHVSLLCLPEVMLSTGMASDPDTSRSRPSASPARCWSPSRSWPARRRWPCAFRRGRRTANWSTTARC